MTILQTTFILRWWECKINIYHRSTLNYIIFMYSLPLFIYDAAYMLILLCVQTFFFTCILYISLIRIVYLVTSQLIVYLVTSQLTLLTTTLCFCVQGLSVRSILTSDRVCGVARMDKDNPWWMATGRPPGFCVSDAMVLCNGGRQWRFVAVAARGKEFNTHGRYGVDTARYDINGKWKT
jgi:hypothetical protein